MTGPGGERLLDLAYTRDPNGRIVEIVDGRPVPSDEPSGSARFAYDSAYRLVSAELDPDRPAFAETLSASYDGADRILSRVSSLGDAL